MNCERCGSPILPSDDHATPEVCVKALRRDIDAMHGVIEHLSATTGNVVARVELCHTKGQHDLVFYITTGLKTKDDVLAALISAQLKSAHVFGSLLRRRRTT